MATYVILYKYTEQGLRNIKEAPKRVEAATKAAAKAGMTVKETLWLQGKYDFLAIVEASDDIAATAFNLNNLRQGNVHTHTMRAFTVAEMTKILAKVD
ncbi:MAG TPA: GYD domain-containing protein [Roseiarcus sp.]